VIPIKVESNLNEVIEDFYREAYNQEVERELEDILGKGIQDWVDDLRGSGTSPGTVWPIGKYVRTPKGRRYVYPNKDGELPKGAKDSGRSLRGWRFKQRGTSVVAFNNARDAKKNYYARWIRRRGQRYREKNDLGPAAFEAGEEFEKVMTKVGKDMGAVLSKHMGAGSG
jgi:hypothetical protein